MRASVSGLLRGSINAKTPFDELRVSGRGLFKSIFHPLGLSSSKSGFGKRGAFAHHFLTPTLFLAALVTAVAAQGPCPGDCDLDDAVSVAELVTSVNIALGNTSLSRCEAADADDDGAVAIDELVGAVQSALTQCGRVTPTPGATFTTSATRTRTATRTPSPTPQLEGDELVQAASDVALQTVESFELLDFGFLGDGGGGGAVLDVARAEFRLAASRRMAPAGRDKLGSGAGGLVGDLCSGGGGADRRCNVVGRTATLRIVFDGCRSSTASLHSIVRDGRVTIVAEDPDLCQTGVVAPGADVTLVFEGFRQVETASPGGQLAVIVADLKDIFEPSGIGCAGQEGRESIDGALSVQCTPRAESIACGRGGADVTLRAASLVVQRDARPSPCTLRLEVNGNLDTDDRIDKERFAQALRAFVLTEAAGPNGETAFTQDGEMGVDCLGGLRFDTKTGSGEGGPLRFPDDGRCPIGGEIVLSVNSAPSPRFIYNPNGGVGFDFDGDGRIDKTNSRCRTGALATCQ